MASSHCRYPAVVKKMAPMKNTQLITTGLRSAAGDASG
jgi:hypothetical protein